MKQQNHLVTDSHLATQHSDKTHSKISEHLPIQGTADSLTDFGPCSQNVRDTNGNMVLGNTCQSINYQHLQDALKLKDFFINYLI